MVAGGKGDVRGHRQGKITIKTNGKVLTDEDLENLAPGEKLILD
jgi:hypothetical protein